MLKPNRLKVAEIAEILKAKGSLREIAQQYRVSHSTIRRIKKGDHKPRKPLKQLEICTARGTLTQHSLVRRKDNRFWIELKVSASEAAPIIKQVEKAISDRLTALSWQQKARDAEHVEPEEGEFDTTVSRDEPSDELSEQELDEIDELMEAEFAQAERDRAQKPQPRRSLIATLMAKEEKEEAEETARLSPREIEERTRMRAQEDEARARMRAKDALEKQTGKATESMGRDRLMDAYRDEEEMAAETEAGEEEERLSEMFEAKASEQRPYAEQEDGSCILTFESTPLRFRKKFRYQGRRGKTVTVVTPPKPWGKPPKFNTVDGSRTSKLETPKLVTEGRKLSVVFSVIARFERAKGIVAVLRFTEANVRRQHALRAKKGAVPSIRIHLTEFAKRIDGT